jgi:hypothetical protein
MVLSMYKIVDIMWIHSFLRQSLQGTSNKKIGHGDCRATCRFSIPASFPTHMMWNDENLYLTSVYRCGIALFIRWGQNWSRFGRKLGSRELPFQVIFFVSDDSKHLWFKDCLASVYDTNLKSGPVRLVRIVDLYFYVFSLQNAITTRPFLKPFEN